METIDLTPTWTQILPMLLHVIEHGEEPGKQAVRDELRRMAKAADAWNENARNSQEPSNG